MEATTVPTVPYTLVSTVSSPVFSTPTISSAPVDSQQSQSPILATPAVPQSPVLLPSQVNQPVPTVSAPVSSKVNDRPPSLHSAFTNSHFAQPLASDFCLYLSILRDFLRRHLLEFIGPSPSILIDPPCSRFSCRCSTMVTTCSTALALIAAVQDDHREKVRYLLQACGIDPQEILRILPRQKSILLLC